MESNKEKQVRYDLVNTFYYFGVITDVTEPTQVVVDGEAYISRRIKIEWRDSTNVRHSEITMSIPDNFNQGRLKKMMDNKVFAKFHFCIKCNSERYGFFCMSVEPLDEKYARLRQEVYYDPYIVNRKFKKKKIMLDKEGYLYPYGY
jgi:hypothetical protein